MRAAYKLLDNNWSENKLDAWRKDNVQKNHPSEKQKSLFETHPPHVIFLLFLRQPIRAIPVRRTRSGSKPTSPCLKHVLNRQWLYSSEYIIRIHSAERLQSIGHVRLLRPIWRIEVLFPVLIVGI